MADQNGLPQTIEEFNAFNVNRSGWEKIAWSLYDRQPYLAAGQSQLNFFQASSSGRTLSDTNMPLGGQLPTNQVFLIQGIEILFNPTTPTVAAAMPAAVGAAALPALINDAYIFFRAGNFNLIIGSKPYLQVAPLGKFPSSRNFHLDAGVSQAGEVADSSIRVAFGSSIGRPYVLNPPLLLIQNQNFSVSLNWPEGVQAIVNPASVFVSLEGTLVRRSQ